MKILVVGWKYLLVLMLAVGALSLFVAPSTANAAEVTNVGSCGDASLLGFPAWYNGLAQPGADGKCDIKSPTEVGGVDKFIWTIVFNVVEMLLRLAGYASALFIIYGGYKYITSAGSSDGMSAAKKTITNAVIGLVLSIAAVAIVRTLTSGFGL